VSDVTRRILIVLLILVVTAGLGTGCSRRRSPPGPPPSAAPTSTAPGQPTPSAPTPSPSTPAPTRTSPSRQPPQPSPPPGIPQHLRGRDLEFIPTAQPIVALTFDAGANADGLISVLNTLATQRVAGTFFVTGSFADRYPNAIRAVAGGGHRLANHSYSHPYLTQKSDSQIRTDLARGEAAIRALGADPRPLFRFPFGDRNSRTIAAVNSAGYVSVRWTVDTLGWKGTSEGMTAQRVIDRVLSTARPGQIVLMHVGSHPEDRSTLDADALPTVINQLRARGYRFVTLDALLTS